jgi:hypothetical protein
MSYPSFNVGEVLTAADMNAVGLWRVTNCTVTSVGGTAATASNGVITIGTGNTSVTVANAFSANYDGYIIKIIGGSSSAGTNLSFRLGASTTGYYSGGYVGNYNTALLTALNDNNTSAFTRGGVGLPNALTMDMRLDNPFAAKVTLYKADYIGADTTSAAGLASGFHNVATSYTDFTVFPTTGGVTMTGGTIRVYGYRN